MTHTTNYEIRKRYWSIGEVAKEINQSASGIRFWLKHFGIEVAHRNHHGNRLFTANEVEKIKQIKHLVKDEGYTLKGAQRKMQIVN